jgi:hypothetical protein
MIWYWPMVLPIMLSAMGASAGNTLQFLSFPNRSEASRSAMPA